ncbi:MAG: FAD-dependent oxidoreductase, partial [Gammaproteobacteria bacterium]|nr:FAD-dependent oxidoreductase [Gammaproteobacteria bacterium]
AIIGGGISGTALLYLLARYTDLSRITLLEKYPVLAQVNSHGRNNSQTLHCGDIETNYTLEKALQVQKTARMVERYAEAQPERERLLFRYPKMALGVGERECRELRERFELFSPHYPGMRLLEREQIARAEPKLAEGRREEIVALATRGETSAIDFNALAHSFAEQARACGGERVALQLGTEVKAIEASGEGYRLSTSRGELRANFVVVSAGGHSLLYAQRLGYGREYSCLPIAGSFYYTPPMLNGKVYTVQNPKLPFAAIHGDPDLLEQGKTRFGPTALALPLLERHNLRTFSEYLEVLRPDMDVARVMFNLLGEREIRNYMFKNMLFEVPLLRRHLFLKEAQKIVPSLKLEDLTFAKGIGGIRPVLIDKANRKLHLGEARIAPGNGLIFNMTPSPGATSCLGNAENDLNRIAEHLQCTVHRDRLAAELHGTQESAA